MTASPRALAEWVRAGVTPTGERTRRTQRWCRACGTWVHAVTKRHQCDLPEAERGKRWRWCPSCLSYVRLSVKRHRCDAPPLEIPDGVRWKRCRSCRELLPRTRECFAFIGAYCRPVCRECTNAPRRTGRPRGPRGRNT